MNSYLNIKLSQFYIWISREKSEPIREEDLNFFKFEIIYVRENKTYFQLQPYFGFRCKH